ncbi:MAG: hypothetical protein ACTHJ4_04920, partial [Candidatus Nucleicultricaceae bacterium]
LINSAIGTYCYAAPAAQALLGTVEATSSQSVILPVCFSLSCISLYYSARRAKTYLTHKKEMDYEPPLVSSGASLGLGIIGTYIRDQGQSIVIIGSETIEGCRRLGFIPVEYITNDPNFLGSSAYWKCTKPSGSLTITRTGELLGFYSEFKMARAFYQMGVNAIDLFRARATITKVDLDDDNLNIPAAAPQASLRRLKSKHTKITPAAITSNDTYSYYGGDPSTTPQRYKPEPVRIKEKRHGTPWASNIDEHRPEEPEIYNLEGSPQYLALQQINECRRYNTVKKAYIDTLLKDTCKFVDGCIESSDANGRYIVLIKGDRAVKIFYEEPHGKSSSDYTGYKLKRVLNAMETAYAYRWTEEGVRAYLTSIGQDTFYTIPKQMLHILWAPERL